MYEIIPSLFLANYRDASQSTPPGAFVVNCTKDLPMISTYGVRIAVNDDLSTQSTHVMTAAFPGVIDSIDQVRKAGGKVVVHCAAGQQRSAAVVAAYLMSKGISLQEAISYIKSKKQDAFLTGVNFLPSLESFGTRRYR